VPQPDTTTVVKTLARERDFDLAGICAPEGEGLPAWVGSVLVLGMYTPDDVYDFDTYVEIAGRRRWHKMAYFRFYNHERLHQSLDYRTPAEVHYA